MSKKLYKATFRGLRKTAKSPSYNDKNACYRWLVNNSHRIHGELLVYEIDVKQARNGEETIATANEFPNLRFDKEQFINENTFHNAEHRAFSLGRQTLFGILNKREDAKLGLA
jgi:hypothetical protein